MLFHSKDEKVYSDLTWNSPKHIQPEMMPHTAPCTKPLAVTHYMAAMATTAKVNSPKCWIAFQLKVWREKSSWLYVVYIYMCEEVCGADSQSLRCVSGYVLKQRRWELNPTVCLRFYATFRTLTENGDIYGFHTNQIQVEMSCKEKLLRSTLFFSPSVSLWSCCLVSSL